MSPNTLFDNFLSNPKITPTRLRNFAESTENRLTADTGQDWSAVLDYLSPAIGAVSAELGDVDTAVNIRMGRTMTVDQAIAQFKNFMSEQEPFIAAALGGRDTPQYLEFFPAGITEYRGANKTNIRTKLQRLRTAAGAHAPALGASLSDGLGNWLTTYDNSRDAQQQQKEAVDGNRSERSAARMALETAMLRAIHTVGERFPGNVQQCSAYFEFERLYAPVTGGGNETEHVAGDNA